MTDPQTPATEAAAEVLLTFVLGKDVPHHVRRVVTDFVPRIQREAREQLDVTLLRRVIEEALVDDESGMETFDADVVAREYARIIRARP